MKGWTDPDLDGPLDKLTASADPDLVDRPAKGRPMRFKWVAWAAALSAPIILMMTSRPRPEPPPPSLWPVVVFGDEVPRRMRFDPSGAVTLAPEPDFRTSLPPAVPIPPLQRQTPAPPGRFFAVTPPPPPPPRVKFFAPPQPPAPAAYFEPLAE